MNWWDDLQSKLTPSTWLFIAGGALFVITALVADNCGGEFADCSGAGRSIGQEGFDVVLYIIAGALVLTGILWEERWRWLASQRHCPHCAERIKDAAKVCRHCGRDLPGGHHG